MCLILFILEQNTVKSDVYLCKEVKDSQGGAQRDVDSNEQPVCIHATVRVHF